MHGSKTCKKCILHSEIHSKRSFFNGNGKNTKVFFPFPLKKNPALNNVYQRKTYNMCICTLEPDSNTTEKKCKIDIAIQKL